MRGVHGVIARDLVGLELVSVQDSVITQDQLMEEHPVLEKRKNSNFATLNIVMLEKILGQNNVVISLKVCVKHTKKKIRDNIYLKLITNIFGTNYISCFKDLYLHLFE